MGAVAGKDAPGEVGKQWIAGRQGRAGRQADDEAINQMSARGRGCRATQSFWNVQTLARG